MNVSGQIAVRFESNDKANRRVHGDRELRLRLSGRDETRTRIDQKSREKKRNDTNNLGRTKAEERRRINEELNAVDQRVEGDGERVLLLSLAVEHGDSPGRGAQVGANRAKPLYSVQAQTRRCRIFLRGKLASKEKEHIG